MEFEAVCAQLCSAAVGTVAQCEGIVWGQIKGYPFWPAQIIAADRAAKDADLTAAKPAKGHDTALQFFGDCSKAWLPNNKVISWAEGCNKGYLKGKKKEKAVCEVLDYLQHGALPHGWWQEPLKHSPMNRAQAAGAAGLAAAAAAAAAAPQQRAPKKADAGPLLAEPVDQQAAAGGQDKRKQMVSKADTGLQADVVEQQAAAVGQAAEVQAPPPAQQPSAAQHGVEEQQQEQQEEQQEQQQVQVPQADSMEIDTSEQQQQSQAGAQEAPQAMDAAGVPGEAGPQLDAAPALPSEGPTAAATPAATPAAVPEAPAVAPAPAEGAPALPALEPPVALGAEQPVEAAGAAAADDQAAQPAAAWSPAGAAALAAAATVMVAAAPAGAAPTSAAAGAPAALPAPRPAGSGSTSTRDMLRSVFNRIKLLHPAAARLETPNSVVDLLAALQRHFGPALALTTEQLRGKDANDLMATLFTWVAGRPITSTQVERCFPLVPHGKVLMPYVLWDRITELGVYPLHWRLPLVKEQVEQGQQDGAAGVPAPLVAPACRVAAPGSAPNAAPSHKKKRVSAPPAVEPRAVSEPRPQRASAAPRPQQDSDGEYVPTRPARRHSALAGPSRFAVEGANSRGGSGGTNGLLQQLQVAPGTAVPGGDDGQERASSPSLTSEELASSQRALRAGKGPGLAVVDGRIVRPRAGSNWPGTHVEGWDTPPALEGKNALPSYVHLRQNVWVSKQRPKRLQRDDVPVCNCRPPSAPAVSSRRLAMEQQAVQRQQVAQQQQLQRQQQQQAQRQHQAEQQRLTALSLVSHPLPLPCLAAAGAAPLPLFAPPAPAFAPAPAPSMQRAAQFTAQPQPAPVSASPTADATTAPGLSPDGGKKRVRRTDWEGRRCGWCGVTETSNWRRHPEDRDMLLCNQCGGYVRKHGKLSEERKERVAAQQLAAALSGPTPAQQQLLPEGAAEVQQQQLEPICEPALPSAPAVVQQQQQVQQQEEQAAPPDPLAAAPAAPAAASEPEGMQVDATAAECAEAQAPEPSGQLVAAPVAQEPADSSAAHTAQPTPALMAEPAAEAMQVDAAEGPAAAQAAAVGPAPPAAAVAALSVEEVAAEEERQAVAALVAAVFRPWVQDQVAAVQAAAAPVAEPKQEDLPQLMPSSLPVLPSAPVQPPPVHEVVVPEVKAAPAEVQAAPAEVKAAPAEERWQQPVDALLAIQQQAVPQQVLAAEQPAATRRSTAAAALAAAQAAPTRSGSGSLRRSAGAAASTAAPQVGCGDNCLNRLSFIHCDRSTCPCGDRCTNRPFAELAAPAMEVYLTPDKGWGVRAAAFIPRGSFIVEYAGEIIDDKECNRRAEEYKRRNEPHFYMMEMAPGLIIDAHSKGNLARLLNSSCDPNCVTQKWHDAGNSEVRVGIFSLRDIMPGEELTYDYQFQHFGLAAAAGAYRCKCGAPKCRGTMDTQPERMRDYGRRLDVWWPGERRYFRGTITGFSAATQRHTVKYDDGDTGRIYMPAEKYRWVDEYGNVVGDTHEPEANARPGSSTAGRKRGGGEGGGGGKRQKRSTMELLGGGGSSGSDLQGLAPPAVPAAPPAVPAAPPAVPAAPPAIPAAPPAVPAVTPAGNVSVEPAAPPAAQQPAQQQAGGGSAPMEVVAPATELAAAAGLQAGAGKHTQQQQQHHQPPANGQWDGPVQPAVGVLLPGKGATPGEVLDSYTQLNLAHQRQPAAAAAPAPWCLLPAAMPAPSLSITGLTVSLLPPPTQAGPLPEAPPLDTTSMSPLAANTTAATFNPFTFGSTVASFESLAARHQALSACGLTLGTQQHPPVTAVGAAAAADCSGVQKLDMFNGGLPDGPTLIKEEPQQHMAPAAAAAVAAPAADAMGTDAGAQAQAQAAPEVRQLRDPSLQPISGTIGHRRGRGNAQPALADAEPSRPRRTVRRPARRFDDDFEGAEPDSDEDYVPSQDEEPSSPPRAAASRARASAAATLSPTTQAAVTMATLLGSGQGGLPPVLPAQHAVVARQQQVKKEEQDGEAGGGDDATEPAAAAAAVAAASAEGLSTRATARRAPSGPVPVHVPATAPSAAGAPRVGGNRRNAPTPASTGLPARTILVAKRLTNSDVSKGRILLPRAAVEANLSFAIGKAHSLIARDHMQQTWEFTLQSWANGSRAGMESRRVYVLEHAGDFVRAHALKPDDVIGLSSSDDGAFLVEYNTEEVLAASENLAGARFGQPAPVPAAGSVRPAAANMLIQQNAGRCMRSEHCTKPAGHPGFCVRTHAAAAAAAARKARQANAAAAAAASQPAAGSGDGSDSDDAPAVVLGSRMGSGALGVAADLAGVKREASLFDDGEERPKRARKPTEKATALGGDDEVDEESDDDYLAAAAAKADAIAEAAADSDAIGSDDDGTPPLMHPTFFQLKARPPAAQLPLPAVPPPPVPGPNVPPIFVMAPDPAAAAATAPPQLRSPLRPSLSMQSGLQHASSLHHSASLPLPPLHHSGSLPLHHSASGSLTMHHSAPLPPPPSAGPVPHPGAGISLPLAAAMGAPVMPPASLPQALPLSITGNVMQPARGPSPGPGPGMPQPLHPGSAPPPPGVSSSMPPQQMPMPPQPGPHALQSRPGTPAGDQQQQGQQQQGQQAGQAGQPTNPSDYLAGSSPEDEAERRKQQQQQPPQPLPLPKPQQGPPALQQGLQQGPPPPPQQQPGKPLPPRPLHGPLPPPRPGMPLPPPRPGMPGRPMLLPLPLPRPGGPPPGMGPPPPGMPGPLGAPPYLPPRSQPGGMPGPPASGPLPLFGGAPPANAPGVGMPHHYHHHHHHPPHPLPHHPAPPHQQLQHPPAQQPVPQQPQQPDFDPMNFLSE